MSGRFTAALGAGLLALASCSEPTIPTTPSAHSAAGGTTKFWNASATTRWNALADSLTLLRSTNAFRLFAYLSLAQLRAGEAAAATGSADAPISAAIGGASAVVLESFFPLDVGRIEAALDAQEAADPWPGGQLADFATGEAIGRAVGVKVNAYAQTDGFGLTDPGTPPVGPGYWVSSGTIARVLLGVRPFYLSRPDELRPGAPPAFGSSEFLAALAEVRLISDTRTAEQIAIAQYWHTTSSPAVQTTINGIARELIARYRKSDLEAAKIMFLTHSAAFDAIAACLDAKYAYWFIRPSQADPLITLVVGLPPHPSYPSGHSCGSGAYAGVLGQVFPSERARLDAIAKEASISRLYAGIHYRFDLEAGLAIGRGAAAKALAADLSVVAPLP